MSEQGTNVGLSGDPAESSAGAVSAPPGWYTVSPGTNSQSFWDGAQWTRMRRWRGTGWVEDAAPGTATPANGRPQIGLPALPAHTSVPSHSPPPSPSPGRQPMGPGGRPPMAPATNGYAVASLVLSIVTVLGIGSLLGIVFGFKARREIRESNGYEGGDGLALAGIIIGFVTLAVSIVVLAIWISLFVTVNSAIHSGLDARNQEVAACQADAKTVEVALTAYEANPTGTHAYPVPPTAWSATTYFANYGVLDNGPSPFLRGAPDTSDYVVEFDSSGNVWVAPGGTFEPSFDAQQSFGSNENACAEAIG